MTKLGRIVDEPTTPALGDRLVEEALCEIAEALEFDPKTFKGAAHHYEEMDSEGA